MPEAKRECAFRHLVHDADKHSLMRLSQNNSSFMSEQVAAVVVAFPATPLLLSRARICISASHTREDLIKGLEVKRAILSVPN